MPIFRFLAVLGAGAVVGSLALAATEDPLPSPFGETVDVRLVNVEVVVTRRDGRRVPGLGAGDFRLVVDGSEVPIDNFSEIRDGEAVEAAVPEASAGTSPPAQPAAFGRVPTHYLVYVDDQFSIGAQRNRVLTRLEEQLSALGPDDAMALVAYDGRRLKQLCAPSPALAELRACFEAARQRPAYGAIERSAGRSLTTNPEADAGVQLPSWLQPDQHLNSQQRAYAKELEAKLSRQVSAASAAMRAASRVSGRKVLLLLAGGWPFSPQEATTRTDLTFPEGGLKQGEQLYRGLSDTANLHGFTIYPVDLPGLGGGETGIDAALAGGASPGRFDDGGGRDASSAISAGTPLGRESNVEMSLTYLARETGGRAMLNSLAEVALTRAAEDTRTYYWLGFQANRRRDDRPHRIKVEMRPPGLEARFRRNFLDQSFDHEVGRLVEGGLLFGGGASDLPLEVYPGLAERKLNDKMRVPLTIGIPVDGMTVVKVGTEYVAELRLGVGVLDGAGNLSEVSVTPIRLSSEKEPRSGKHVRYNTALKVWKEPHEVVIAVLDPASGKVSSRRFEVTP